MVRKTCHLCGDVLCIATCEGDAQNLAHGFCILAKRFVKIATAVQQNCIGVLGFHALISLCECARLCGFLGLGCALLRCARLGLCLACAHVRHELVVDGFRDYRTGALAQHEGIAQSLIRQCKIKLTLGDLCAILVLVHVPHLGTALNLSLAC